MSRVHKRFTPDQVKELLERYSNKEIQRKHIQEILGIKKSRFYSYRQISMSSLQFKVHADPTKRVNLRIHPFNDQISEIGFWCEGKLIDIQKVKSSELKGVHF